MYCIKDEIVFIRGKYLLFCLILFFLFIIPSHGQWKDIYPLKDNFLDVQVVSPVAAYVVGSDYTRGSIYKTIDAGKKWTKVSVPDNLNQSGNFISASFINIDTGYVLNREQAKVLRTNNGGVSWNAVSLNIIELTDKIKFPIAAVGYVHTETGKILKSIDYGASWTQVVTPETGTNAAVFITDQILELVYGNRVYKSVNGGANWSFLGIVDPLNPLIGFNKLYFFNENIGFAFNSFEVYKTIDGGNNWFQVGGPFTGNPSATLLFFFTPLKGIYLSGSSRINMTTDDHISFFPVFDSHHSMIWNGVDFKNNFGCAVSSGNTIITSSDQGSNWTIRNIVPGQDLFRDIDFPTDSTGLVIGAFWGAFRTTDASDSWYFEEKSIDRDDKYNLVFTPDKSAGLLEVYQSSTYLTTDHGMTFANNPVWQRPYSGFYYTKDYQLFNNLDIFVIGNRADTSIIAHTSTGGAIWQLTQMANKRLNGFAFPTWDVGYACGNAGKMVKTNNHGLSWSDLSTPVSADLTKVFFRNITTGYAAGWQGLLLKTIDGGTSWNSYSTQMMFPVIGLQFLNDTVGYCFTSIGEISRTSNGGTSWTRLASGDPTWTLSKVEFKNDSIVFAVGNKSIYKVNLNALAPPIPTGVFSLQQRDNKVRLFPNPASGQINGTIQRPIHVNSISIYDLSGNRIRNHPYQERLLSSFSEDISSLPSGVYILAIVEKNLIISAYKFIKQK